MIQLSLQDARLIIELNGQRFDDIQALRTQVKAILALGVQPPVIVDPSDQITMNMAVAVYDAARAAGADRVLFAAQPE